MAKEKRNRNRWKNKGHYTEENSGEYIVEIGTYLPIAKRVEDLKKAGMDLLAYRQAYADFANGTREIDLDEYDNELMDIDEIDFMKKKARYLEVMTELEKRQKEALEKQQKEASEKAFEAEVTKRLEAQKQAKSTE